MEALRDPVQRPGLDLALERADQEALVVLTRVEARVGVTQDGQGVVAGAQPGDRLGDHVVMRHRDDRQRHADGGGELARPLTGGEDDDAGSDLPGAGLEPPARRRTLEAGHGRGSVDPRSAVGGALRVGVREARRIDPAVGREVGRADEVDGIHERKQLRRPRGRDDVERHVEELGDAGDVGELVEPVA